MANCTVSGTFLDPSGTAISGATVRFNIDTPVFDAGGVNVIGPKEISTTTDTSGNWSLAITQGASGTLSLDCPRDSVSGVTRYSFACIIPSTSSASFSSVWADSQNLASATYPLQFAQIQGQLSVGGLPVLASTNFWVGNQSSVATPVAMSGDATMANTGAVTVASVGGSTAANVHTAELAANAATNANTVSTIVKRDASGNFSAGTITASLTGNVTGTASGNVTSVALTAPGGFSVTGSPVTASGTLALAANGTSGGVLYYSGATTTASSGALAASQVVLGGGAGAAPTTLAAGSQYQVLRMGAATPAYGSVNLDQSAAVTGTLPVANLPLASASDQQTGTSNAVVVTPGVQKNHPSAAKVWIVFTWSGGTPTVLGSLNVSSLTDTGPGDTTVNFTNTLANANFACGLGYQSMNIGAQQQLDFRNFSVSSLQLRYSNNGTATDNTTNCSAIMFGVQ